MQVNLTVLLAELPVSMLLSHCVPYVLFQRLKKKKFKNHPLKADFMCFSADFNIAVFNSIT